MTSAALCHKAVSEGELQGRIAVGVLESSITFYVVGVFLSVQLVGKAEVHRPFQSDICAFYIFFVDAQTYWKVCRKSRFPISVFYLHVGCA